MKQALLNLFFALIAFILVYGIALLTGLTVVQEGVLIAFVIQWICFIPAYFFQTEKFYDLAGSCTYLFMVGYVSYQSYSSLNLNTASMLLTSDCVSSSFCVAIGSHCASSPPSFRRDCASW